VKISINLVVMKSVDAGRKSDQLFFFLSRRQKMTIDLFGFISEEDVIEFCGLI
jgi:hypothetical protein